MYLKQIPNKKSARIFLSIVQPYRHKESGNTRTKTVKPLGYLDELAKEYDDPIAHFTRMAQAMTQDYKEAALPISLEIQPLERLSADPGQRKNLGYAALSSIYHELGIHSFWTNRQRNLALDYQLDQIFRMLVYQRILDPGSKKYSFEHKEGYFETYDFSLDDVYRALSRMNGYKDALLLKLHQNVTKFYGRDTSNVFYDVTNYYFEIESGDELRRKGVSKEHRPDPIVQMGLLMDRQGLPITYKLFSGNTNDCNTLLPVLAEVKEDYDLKRMVVVADKGLNTGENIGYNLIQGDGYIYSQTIRGATRELQQYVLDPSGYRSIGENFRIKSRFYPRVITVTDIHDKQVKVTIDEKQILFFSEKYARRAKAEREPAIQKALQLIQRPGAFTQSTSQGAAKYVKDLIFNKKTGEIITAGHIPHMDLDRIAQEEALDGYYAIVTSELDMTDEDVIETYRGLWRIEESFRITKSELEARPVYVSREDRINAHFLTCFVSLLLLRCLQTKTEFHFSARRLVDSLNSYSGSKLEENLFVFDHRDEVLDAVGQACNIDFSLKYRTLGEIKKLLAKLKK